MAALTPLHVDDAEIVWGWLREQLVWHIGEWARACDLGWEAADIDARIRDGRLLEKEWTELLTASEAEDSLVRLARDLSGRPLGAIYATTRPDPYLGLPVGVLSWLHVDPAARGQGLARPLIQAALDWYAERGLPLAEVYVTAVNAAAVRAYTRGGFEIVDHRMLVAIPGR